VRWLTRRPEPARTHSQPDDLAAEMIDAHRRIRAAKAHLRVLMVRLAADRKSDDTGDCGRYLDLALDVARALDGRQP
jgi:hypothetical protein